MNTRYNQYVLTVIFHIEIESKLRYLITDEHAINITKAILPHSLCPAFKYEI
jgi:hypothetical protein